MKSIPRNVLHGWINLNKPLHLTSADAVNQVKRLIRPSKIGHAGTLDPLATGVLPLALGEGTKCIHLLMDAKKTYDFSVTFGERRSTDDAEGEVIATSSYIPTMAEIQAILPQFIGAISQVPPIYSALKVNGKRAYDLARAGQEVELKARQVMVYELEVMKVESPGSSEALESFSEVSSRPCAGIHLSFCKEAGPRHKAGVTIKADSLDSRLSTLTTHFRATVSKGTYIRSLGRDMAQALGTEGYISRLHRASVGPFTDAQAISLDFLAEYVHNAPPPTGEPRWLTPLERALDDIPATTIEGGQLSKLRQGQRIALVESTPDVSQIAVLYQKRLVALARVERGILIPVRLLNVESR